MMKKTLFYISGLTLLLGGCSSQDTSAEAELTGTLRLNTAIDGGLTTRAEVDSGSRISPDQLSLRIVGKDYDRSWTSLAEYNDALPRLMKGDYTFSLSHGTPASEGKESPYFFGEEQFTVLPRQQISGTVTVGIANAQVAVRLTPAFTGYFHDARFTVSTGAGNQFTLEPATAGETLAVYVAADAPVSVTGEASRQAGDRVQFAPQQLDKTVKRTRHTFVFDARSASHATVTITLDDTVTETRDIFVELNGDA